MDSQTTSATMAKTTAAMNQRQRRLARVASGKWRAKKAKVAAAVARAKAKKAASIKIKINNLTDVKMIDKLYDASRAGVKVQLIIRGICCLIPGVAGMSENIEAISIVDNYLEHSRVYIFANNGNPDIYISSADFMTRNIDARVEVSCPIYDEDVKKELIDSFDVGWKGNVKARLHSEKLDNKYRVRNEDERIFRAQIETYNYYRDKLEVNLDEK